MNNKNKSKILFKLKVFMFSFTLAMFYSVKSGINYLNFIADSIKIEVDKNSPPLIALEEVDAVIENNQISPEIEGTPLQVGNTLLPNVELEEFVISEVENNTQLQELDLNRNYAFDNSDKINKVIKNSEIDYPQNYDEEHTYGNNSSNPQLSEKIAQLLAEEKSEETENSKLNINNNRTSNSVSNGNGISNKFDNNNVNNGIGLLNDFNGKSEGSYSSSNEIETKVVKTPHGNILVSGINQNNSHSDKQVENLSPSILKIQGQIEFSRNSDPLLVLTPDHRIEVRRFAEGVPHEYGEIKTQSGTFSIDLKNNYGSIVAQLINSHGIVEGEATLPVATALQYTKKSKIPKLVLHPVQKASVSVASAYGTQYEKDFFKSLNFDLVNSPEIATQVGGDLSQASIFHKQVTDKNIESVLQVSAPSHVSTTAIISLHTGADIMLMPDKMLENLTEILSDQGVKLNLDKGDSLIWGTVKDKGQPIAGATIYSSKAQPVYLGSLWMPDVQMTKTSDNGMFVIVVNEAGWKDLFVQVENGPQLHLNVLTFPGRISQVVAELPNHDVPVSVRTFDAFNGEPVRTRVQLQQVEDVFDTGEQGLKVVQIPNSSNLSLVNIFPEPPYVDSKQSYTAVEDYLHLPIINGDWLEQIKTQKRINVEFDKGIIVGFVQNEDYNLIPLNEEQSSENLVYFNSSGEVISSGAAGGGFILFNQSKEFETISIKNRKNNLIYNKIAFPESRFLFLLNFTL